jgi:hypothetical protein
VELFETIRREYEHGGGSIRGIAKKLGIHRRMVREAMADANPRERKIGLRSKPKLESVVGFIDGIVQTGRKAPRKQRHSAPRMCRVPDYQRGYAWETLQLEDLSCTKQRQFHFGLDKQN